MWFVILVVVLDYRACVLAHPGSSVSYSSTPEVVIKNMNFGVWLVRLYFGLCL